MATSGSVDFSLSRDQVITAALKKIGALAAGETASSEEVSDAAITLNMMLKSMQADGLKIFLRKRATVFLEKDKSAYSFTTTTSGDHSAYSYTRTQIKTAASASATSIDVDSTTGMTAGDYIGFELDDGTSHWTTIASITDSDTVVINSGLASAAAVDNYVYFYTTKIDRPLRVVQAWVRDEGQTSDIPVVIVSQKEYYELANKTAEGRPNTIYYDPQLNNGTLWVWPEPDSVTDTLELIVQRPIEDMDAAANEFDVPVEWLEPIVYGLAYRLCPEYRVPLKVKQDIERNALMFLEMARSFDIEHASVFLQPEIR